MEGIIITAIICGTVIMISLIDKIGKNKCKNCKHIKNVCVSGCISNEAKKEIFEKTYNQLGNLADDIESMLKA